MKAVILAGGRGTRLSEETIARPKPLVEIGGRPILWHIMKIYSAHGVNEFIVCCGYRGEQIRDYFANYLIRMSDVTFDLTEQTVEIHSHRAESWRVTVVDTGEETQTAGRLKRVASYLQNDDAFCFTYGDGVSNIDISASIEFHRAHGKLATLAAVLPPARFGALKLNGSSVTGLVEKPQGEGGWINGGFFVLSPRVLERIDGDQSSWEIEIIPRLAEDQQLEAYKHLGFWQPMDTLRDKQRLEQLWNSGRASWKVW
jgi:glucose-1-phosphate cytidylyltransferase